MPLRVGMRMPPYEQFGSTDTGVYIGNSWPKVARLSKLLT